MCLSIPMKIVSISGFNAYCQAKGVEREVSLFMLQDETLQAGDFVVVHLGHAVRKISAREAKEAWEVYDEMLALADGA